MYCDCCVALPRGAMGLSAVCDCGISRSYSLTIFAVILLGKRELVVLLLLCSKCHVAFIDF